MHLEAFAFTLGIGCRRFELTDLALQGFGLIAKIGELLGLLTKESFGRFKPVLKSLDFNINTEQRQQLIRHGHASLLSGRLDHDKV